MTLTFVDNLSDLITFAVFNLAFSFLLCALALIRLHATEQAVLPVQKRLLPFLAVLIAGWLLATTSTHDKLIGCAVILAGLMVYAAGGRGEALPHALHELGAMERGALSLARRRVRFLGALIGWPGDHRTPK